MFMNKNVNGCKHTFSRLSFTSVKGSLCGFLCRIACTAPWRDMFRMSKKWSMRRINFAIPSISAVPLCSMSFPMVSLNIWKCCNRNTLVTLFPNLIGDNVLNMWHFFSLIDLTMPFGIVFLSTSTHIMHMNLSLCVVNWTYGSNL